MKFTSSQTEQIKRLCAKHKVESLYLFGSAAKGELNDESDFDFLISFQNIPPEDYFDNYFELKEELELMLKRKVDLLESQTLQNPFLKKSIDASKELVYG